MKEPTKEQAAKLAETLITSTDAKEIMETTKAFGIEFTIEEAEELASCNLARQ